jgi:hypothetical protein
MDNNEMKKLFAQWKSLNNDVFSASIKQYDLSTLENLAVGLAVEIDKRDLRSSHFRSDKVLNLLKERRDRLNSHFEWTIENQKLLLVVNDMFLSTWEKAVAEAKSIMVALENRILSDDNFLADYEIEIELIPYITGLDTDNKKNEIYETIEDLLSKKQQGRWFLSENISHSHFNIEKDRVCTYLDRSSNWNLEYFNHVFDSHYIGLSIHELLDSHIWSFYDILRINYIWTDISVHHQSDFYLKNTRN